MTHIIVATVFVIAFSALCGYVMLKSWPPDYTRVDDDDFDNDPMA